MPPRTYDTIIDFDNERLKSLVERGRNILRINDVLMCATAGKENSLFRDGNRLEATEVALVNLCYAVAFNDWSLVGIAVASLELALSPDNDAPDETGNS